MIYRNVDDLKFGYVIYLYEMDNISKSVW